MLSGDGNENGEKNNNRSSIAKKQLFTCSTLVLYISLPSFCTTTKWNFQKHPGYTFYGGNVVRFLVNFFFSLPHFFTLVAANISYFPIIIVILFIYSALFNMLGDQKRKEISQKFSCCSSDKKMCLLSFISRSSSLSLFFLVELRWPVAYFLFFFVSVFLCIPKLWTWQLI